MSDEAFLRKDPKLLENVKIGELVPISHWDDILPTGDTFADWGLKVVEDVTAPMGTVFVKVIYDPSHHRPSPEGVFIAQKNLGQGVDT